VPELQRLRADHAPAVLAFELANRAYFATFISDRGDEFYDHFSERYNALLAEQEAGTCVFHVLAGEDGTVLGRFNLFDLEDGTARLGYRVAQHVAGRGVATAAVQELCRLAAAKYGLRTLRAAAARQWFAPASLEAAMSANWLLVYQIRVPRSIFPRTFSVAYRQNMSGSGPRYTIAPSPS